VRYRIHGGSCCGISHLSDFDYATYNDFLSALNRHGTSNRLLEAVLTAGQLEDDDEEWDESISECGGWHAILTHHGFQIVSAFRNSNSNNVCYVYHFVPRSESLTPPDVSDQFIEPNPPRVTAARATPAAAPNTSNVINVPADWRERDGLGIVEFMDGTPGRITVSASHYVQVIATRPTEFRVGFHMDELYLDPAEREWSYHTESGIFWGGPTGRQCIRMVQAVEQEPMIAENQNEGQRPPEPLTPDNARVGMVVTYRCNRGIDRTMYEHFDGLEMTIVQVAHDMVIVNFTDRAGVERERYFFPYNRFPQVGYMPGEAVEEAAPTENHATPVPDGHATNENHAPENVLIPNSEPTEPTIPLPNWYAITRNYGDQGPFATEAEARRRWSRALRYEQR